MLFNEVMIFLPENVAVAIREETDMPENLEIQCFKCAKWSNWKDWLANWIDLPDVAKWGRNARHIRAECPYCNAIVDHREVRGTTPINVRARVVRT
jgi:endogenous inhibitor of DNA gyrase (YacG/DUF329 family)